MTSTINASTTAGLVQTADTSGVLALQTAGTTAVSISSGQVVTLTNALAEASGGTGTTVGYYGFKNRIINGAMVIDQRNAGASVTPATGTYTLDRWRAYQNVAGKFTVQQSSTAPNGFTNSTLITSTSAYTASGTDLFLFMQYIEGYNVADLGWGTANAQTVTLSFWVRSSLTGTFGGALVNGAEDRNYPFTYTISSANTFEQKTITIAGDTSGTWLKTNGLGMQVNFGIGAGSTYSGTAGAWAAGAKFTATGATSVVGTNGATFYITGVQLEKGSTATSFDYRPYGTELMLCERYALLLGDGLQGQARTTTDTFLCPFFQQPMRATPTVTMTDTSVQISDNFSANFTSTGSTASQVDMTAYGGRISISGFTGLTLGRTYCAFSNTNGSVMLLSAEL